MNEEHELHSERFMISCHACNRYLIVNLQYQEQPKPDSKRFAVQCCFCDSIIEIGIASVHSTTTNADNQDALSAQKDEVSTASFAPPKDQDDTSRKCLFWNCSEQVTGHLLLCEKHSERLENGQIDICPTCGRYKEKRFANCYDCKFGRPIPEHDRGTVRRPAPSHAIPRKEWPANSVECPICSASGYLYVKRGPRSRESTIRIMCSQCLGKGYRDGQQTL